MEDTTASTKSISNRLPLIGLLCHDYDISLANLPNFMKHMSKFIFFRIENKI